VRLKTVAEENRKSKKTEDKVYRIKTVKNFTLFVLLYQALIGLSLLVDFATVNQSSSKFLLRPRCEEGARRAKRQESLQRPKGRGALHDETFTSLPNQSRSSGAIGLEASKCR
jgi:hypothetical protein